MKRPRRTEHDGKEIEQIIRRSQVLDANLKAHWLRVLPYLSPADRERLRALLASEHLETSPDHPDRP